MKDAIDRADREIDRAEGALAEAKRLMLLLERAPEAHRPEARRNLLVELDSAVKAVTAARKHVSLDG